MNQVNSGEQLQAELAQAKIVGFDLYQQLERSGKQIQMLENALNQIAQISNFTQIQQSGLQGLFEHLQSRLIPSEDVVGD